MLEGTDARVLYIYYTPEMEAARSRGQRFRKVPSVVLACC
jgi:hypothetical protein